MAVFTKSVMIKTSEMRPMLICKDYCYTRSRDSAVGIATGYELGDRGSEFESR
jgi:hypothetical protein